MTYDIIVASAILIGVLFCCVRDVMPAHLAAFTGFAAAVAFGVLGQREMLSIFSNSAPFTIACMFVLTAAIERSGLLGQLVDWVAKGAKERPLGTVCALFAAVAAMAFFLNNTPIVLLFAPLFIRLGQQIRVPASKLLMPLSYMTMMAGMCTLIGTSTNLLADGIAQQYGLKPFSMFELFPAGFATLCLGAAYLFFIGRHLLPVRRPLRDEISDERALPDSFVTDITIDEDSPHIGQTLNDIGASEALGAEIIDLIRNDLGKPVPVKELIAGAMPWNRKVIEGDESKSAVYDVPLKAGYRITLRATRPQLDDLRQFFGIHMDEDSLKFDDKPEPPVLTDMLITNNSHYAGLKISDVLTFKYFGLDVIALHRKGQKLSRNIGNTVLRRGDVLILEGTKEAIDNFKRREHFASVREGDENEAPLPLWRKFGPIVVLMGIILLSSFQIMPIANAAMVGAISLIVLQFVSMKEAYEAIQWPILMLIYGMLGVGLAFEKSGAASGVVGFVIDIVADTNPIIVLSCFYLMTSILTEAMSNNAVAVIMTPLAIGVAQSLGLDPRPFVVAVMLAASSSFATPMSYQTNAYVYTLGNYKFMDFVKVGMPLNIIGWAVATFVIPMVWPF